MSLILDVRKGLTKELLQRNDLVRKLVKGLSLHSRIDRQCDYDYTNANKGWFTTYRVNKRSF